jgi:hypothetical protein
MTQVAEHLYSKNKTLYHGEKKCPPGTILRQPNTKKGWQSGSSECLSSKCEALSSNPRDSVLLTSLKGMLT